MCCGHSHPLMAMASYASGRGSGSGYGTGGRGGGVTSRWPTARNGPLSYGSTLGSRRSASLCRIATATCPTGCGNNAPRFEGAESPLSDARHGAVVEGPAQARELRLAGRLVAVLERLPGHRPVETVAAAWQREPVRERQEGVLLPVHLHTAAAARLPPLLAVDAAATPLI